MDTGVRVRSFFSCNRKGFAIAEVLLAIGLVGMAALIVGGLGQQVLNLAKSSKQTAASIELRTKTNSISRNLDSWLGKMRSSLESNGLYAACIPDPSSATSLFKCPAVDAALLDSDPELKRIAGNQLHAVSAPVIDLLGERIAGTVDEPLYLDLDGTKCQQTNQRNCPLKSTGYFLRSNPAVDSTPGSVRFIVKIEANRSSEQIKGTAPQRTQYLTIDVGSEWQQVVGSCPAGSIKIGYLASGSPNCVHPTKKCAAGTVALGLDNSANPICATPPASCVSGGAVVDTASNTLVCSTSSPCSSNQIFLGYYSGTGTPMCSGTNISCPDGQVQVGIQGSAGSLTALCKTLPSCQDSQKLSYDGSQFVCQSAIVASNCGAGEVVVGINTDGSAKCQPAERNLASTNLNCSDGQYVAGLESDGTVKCERIPTSSGGPGVGTAQVWEDVSLDDTADFDPKCLYQTQLQNSDSGNSNLLNSNTNWSFAVWRSSKFLGILLTSSPGMNYMWGIPSSNRKVYTSRSSDGVITTYPYVTILKLQRSCGAASGQAPVLSCPVGMSLVGAPASREAYCIETNARTGTYYHNAAENCEADGKTLCTYQQWSKACMGQKSANRKPTPQLVGLNSSAEWIFAAQTWSGGLYSGGQIMGHRKHNGADSCLDASALDDEVEAAAATTKYRCCSQ